MNPSVPSLLQPRLLFVTGKGGVGKSTVAATLALTGARSGRRSCLVEVEGRQTMSKLFATQPWDFTEREFRPNLWSASIDPEASLREYLDLFYGAGRISRFVAGSAAVEFATTAAPGIKDVLLVGKVKEMERRRDPDGRFHYDLIVVDAPPTGRIVNFLRAPEATTELVNVGPIRSQAQAVVDMLLDPARTNIVLVTLLEEMPVQETLESAEHLSGFGVTLAPVIANRVLAERLDPDARKAFTDDLEPVELAAVLAEAGVAGSVELAAVLRAEGEAHLGRIALQDEMRSRLVAELAHPLLCLPYVYGERFGPEELEILVRTIEEAID